LKSRRSLVNAVSPGHHFTARMINRGSLNWTARQKYPTGPEHIFAISESLSPWILPMVGGRRGCAARSCCTRGRASSAVQVREHRITPHSTVTLRASARPTRGMRNSANLLCGPPRRGAQTEIRNSLRSGHHVPAQTTRTDYAKLIYNQLRCRWVSRIVEEQKSSQCTRPPGTSDRNQ